MSHASDGLYYLATVCDVFLDAYSVRILCSHPCVEMWRFAVDYQARHVMPWCCFMYFSPLQVLYKGFEHLEASRVDAHLVVNV
jgi:hypothetical protein